ncbi:hypothetical protein ACFWBN_11295 [Streptomyces sp. NPDC059989]|uniref:hypothetical protein n=1 Tax=Streptomyces sp. NPDC059989 TaxID=3347026 RepID=UPI0036B2755F
MTSEFDGTKADVADTFAVHALAVGPITGFPDADTVGEAERTAAVLRRLGGESVVPPLAGDAVRSLTDADESLAHWAGEHGGDGSSRPTALLWFGHGRAVRMGSVLLVPGSKERGNARVTPDMVAHYVHAEQLRREQDDSHWALVVLEACNSENFAQDVAGRFNGTGKERTRSLLVIATGKAAAQGYLGTFRDLLERYLTPKTSHDDFTLRDLQGHFKSHRCYAELVGDETGAELRLALRDRVPLTGATTVADLWRQQSRYDNAPEAWPRRPVPEKVGFLEVVSDFTGRAAHLRAIAAWCADAAGAAVLAVTGEPGAGKSALLGETLQRWTRRGPDGPGRGPAEAAQAADPPPPPIVAVLPLTGNTPADVVRQLAEKLDAISEGPGRDDLDGDDAALDRVRRRLAELTRDSDADDIPAAPTPTRALIVADALDEARDPFRIAALLRELTTVPGVRLLIGTRPTPFATAPGEHRPADGSGHLELPEVLGAASGHARVLVLERDPAAARDYARGKVRDILREHPAGDATWHETVTGTVADAVEAHVREGSWQFLQAALVVQEIEQRPTVLSPGPDGRSALAEMLDRDQSGLFAAAVKRITAGLPTAEPLLRALAYAHGRGLPLADGIWAHAAAGIAGTDGPFDDEQLELFLSRAAAYVLLDGEDRRSVYRLAHRTYAEQLLADGMQDRRHAMLIALLELAAAQARSGQPLSPHLAARLAEYAADCGASGWAALAARPGVVDRLPPASLSTPALTPGRGTGTSPIDLPIEILGTVASAHLIKEAEPGDRPGLRQLGGLRAAGLLHAAGPGAGWEVAWGRLRRVPLHLQLGGSPTAITALVARADAPWLVTGSLDGSVMVWEPWRDHHPTMLLSGYDSPVTALAALGPVRREAGVGSVGPGLLAVAHEDRTVHLWDTDADTDGYADAGADADADAGADADADADADAGADRPEPRRAACTEMVRVIAALPDGSRRFVVGGESGYLALLGPDGALSSAAEAVSSRDVVGLVHVPGPDGAPLVVTAQQSGVLALWKVDGAVPVLVHDSHSHTALAGLVGVPGPTGPHRLVTVSEDGRLAQWRVHTGGDRPTILADTEGRVPEARSGADPVLAALPATGQDGVPVVGDRQGTVRIVGPTAAPGHPALLETSTGSRPIKAIGVLRGPEGGSILVTAAERDSRVHFWDPAAAARTEGAPVVRASWVDDMRRHVLADGTETLVVTEECAGTRTVRVLRAADGALLELPAPSDGSADAAAERAPLPDGAVDQHAGSVVDCVALDGPAGLSRPARTRATAGREGTVVVWREEPASGWRPVRRIPLGSPCVRLTPISSGRLAVATDDGVVVLRLDSVARAGDGGGSKETHG